MVGQRRLGEPGGHRHAVRNRSTVRISSVISSNPSKCVRYVPGDGLLKLLLNGAVIISKFYCFLRASGSGSTCDRAKHSVIDNADKSLFFFFFLLRVAKVKGSGLSIRRGWCCVRNL